ncbi:MAG: hypothetical protein V3S71_04345, partial [Acidobacteriota bacterium]
MEVPDERMRETGFSDLVRLERRVRPLPTLLLLKEGLFGTVKERYVQAIFLGSEFLEEPASVGRRAVGGAP